MTDEEWVKRYVVPNCRTTATPIPSDAQWAIGSERQKDGTLVLLAPRENPNGEPQDIVELFSEKDVFGGDKIESPWDIEKGRIVVHVSFYITSEHVPATPKSGRSGKRKRPPTPSVDSEDDEAQVEETEELEDDIGQSEDPTTPSQRPLILSGVDPGDVDPVPDLHPLTTVQVKSESTRDSTRSSDSSLEDLQ
ncbi:hypothetical protein E4U10_006131 [Claviceps purpurea]|nr:hypothetical protein E4U10_006131 [Claviceps purpurea]